jgi:hypothetical protein
VIAAPLYLRLLHEQAIESLTLLAKDIRHRKQPVHRSEQVSVCDNRLVAHLVPPYH